MPTRREFVRGCIIAGAGVAAAAGLDLVANVVGPAGPPTPPVERLDYVGATLLGGPAVRGVALLPLVAQDDGGIAANPAPRSVPGGVLGWYRYCAHEETPGLQPRFRPGDELVRYFATREKLESAHKAGDDWWADKVGQVARAADFTPGRGAPAAWRSVGMQGKDIITVTLVRPPGEVAYEDATLRDLVESEFAARAPDGGLILGFIAFCPHFCCVMGWHESSLAQLRGQWDTLFCTCHFVVCDAMRIRRDFFVRNAPEPLR